MLVGHTETFDFLKQLAKRRMLSHGYLFWGPPRVGKKTVAENLALHLEGFDDYEKEKHDGSLPPLFDSHLLSPDSRRTVGIESVRALTEFLRKKPLKSPYRLAVIDDAECMTDEAQNALLKASEETPASGIVIAILRNPEMIRDTLRSRLQQLYFPPVPEEDVASWLLQEHKVSNDRARKIAEQSFGEPGRAYALLHNEAFRELQRVALEFFSLRPTARRTFIKSLLANENFQLNEFLDALIEARVLRYRKKEQHGSKEYALWHRVLKLRNQSEYTNLNPRLQLEALLDTTN